MIPFLPFVPLFFWPDSCACEEPTFPCGCDVAISECWELVVAGVADGDCTLCNVANGTWVLEQITECSFAITNFATYRWKHSSLGCISCFNAAWNLGLVAGVWQLYFQNGSSGVTCLNSPIYELDAASFDCDGSNVFTATGTPNSACTSWPATLTIDPIACP